MVACIYVIILILQAVTVNSQNPATLSVTNVIPGATATFECSLPNLTGSTSLLAYKNNVDVYACANIDFTCSKISSDSDYSDVTFTDLGTASAKGAFTVANADQTGDGGDWTCKYGTSLISSPDTFVVSAPSAATLSVTNVLQGATATFECSYPNLESPTTLNIYKDGVALYQCTDIALICSKTSSDNDYSDVSFTDLDKSLAKGTFIVANADQTRDGGEWTCKYGTSLISSPDTFVVSAQSPAILSVANVIQGATATFELSYPNLESPTSLDIYKDSVALYQCTNIASTCSRSSPDNDYSDVTVRDLGTKSAKGTFTVVNADQTRDGGEWTCKYGTSRISPSVTFVVSDYCSWCCFYHHISCWLCIVLIIILIIVLIIVIVVGVLVIWWFCNRHRIGYIHIQKVTHNSIQLRWSMNGLHPKTLGLKAISGEQRRNVGHEDDWTHTVTVQNVSLATSITIGMEFTNKDGRDGEKILMEIQIMKDHIRDMTIEKVTLDTIHLRWSMNGFHPGTLGLKAICKIQDPKVCLELDGTHIITVENVAPDTSITIYMEYKNTKKTLCLIPICKKQQLNDCKEDNGTHTVTAEKLSPDTNNTIYLEYTNKDEKLCKEASMQKQTMKAPTEKPKRQSPLERGSAAGYTPRHEHDGEETHNKPGPLPSIKKLTGIPKSSDGHNTRSHSITDKDSMNCKVHVQD